MNLRLAAVAAFLAATLLPAAVHAERIKDLARVSGVRDNQLIGYGLVVGLNGTGDQTGQTPFTVQSLKAMLNRFGVQIPAETRLQLKNVAAVTVSGSLPPFAKPGQAIDVTVSTIGNAKSLRGGTLLMTPLKGADGQTYAIAQGNLTVGGFGASSDDGASSVTVNVPTVGRVPNGATVERASPAQLRDEGELVLNLLRPDFTTAKRIQDAINRSLGAGTASALDATSVRVYSPPDASQRVAHLSHIENLTLSAGEAPARVIVSSRTGTVVISLMRHDSVREEHVPHAAGFDPGRWLAEGGPGRQASAVKRVSPVVGTYFTFEASPSTAAATAIQAAYLAAALGSSFLVSAIDRLLGRKKTMLLAVVIAGCVSFGRTLVKIGAYIVQNRFRGESFFPSSGINKWFK